MKPKAVKSDGEIIFSIFTDVGLTKVIKMGDNLIEGGLTKKKLFDGQRSCHTSDTKNAM